MFRALVVGLGSICLIALLLMGLKNVDGLQHLLGRLSDIELPDLPDSWASLNVFERAEPETLDTPEKIRADLAKQLSGYQVLMAEQLKQINRLEMQLAALSATVKAEKKPVLPIAGVSPRETSELRAELMAMIARNRVQLMQVVRPLAPKIAELEENVPRIDSIENRLSEILSEQGKILEKINELSAADLPLETANGRANLPPPPIEDYRPCSSIGYFTACATSELPTFYPRIGAPVTYDAGNVLGRSDRAWLEGIGGSGVGESLLIYWPRQRKIKKISITNGYSSTDFLFQNSNRVRQLNFRFQDGSTYNFELADHNGPQAINFDDLNATSWVILTISSVYPSLTDNDTALDRVEISFVSDG